MDPVADVLLWSDRVPGRDSVPERDPEGKAAASVRLRVSERVFYLWRHHESSQYPHGVWAHYLEKPDRFLYFRCAGGFGAGDIHGDLSVDLEPPDAGEAGKDQKKVWAD